MQKLLPFALCFLTLGLTSAYAQSGDTASQAFLLKERTGNGARVACQNPTVKISDISSFKNIPSGYTHSCVRRLAINKDQWWYEKYSGGEISAHEFNEKCKGADTTLLSHTPVPKNDVHMFVGLDHGKGKKHLIVDANNNHDFSDDMEVVVNIADCTNEVDSTRSLTEYNLQTAYFDGDSVRNRVVTVTVSPYQFHYDGPGYADRNERLLDVVVVQRKSWAATVEVEGVRYKVFAWDDRGNLIPQSGSKQFNLNIEDDEDGVFYYSRGEVVRFGRGMYTWSAKARKTDPSVVELSLLKVGKAPEFRKPPR